MFPRDSRVRQEILMLPERQVHEVHGPPQRTWKSTRAIAIVGSQWLELLNFDLIAVVLAIVVYIVLIAGFNGYKGKLSLSSASLLFGGMGNPLVSGLVASKATDDSIVKHVWSNIDPVQCLIIVAQRHNVTLHLDPSIPSSPVLSQEDLRQSHYGQCGAICASARFGGDCAVHYLVPAQILDQHLPILRFNANSSFVVMSDYFLLFQDALQEYQTQNGLGTVSITVHPVTTVSSVFFGETSTLLCDNKPCVVFDTYTSVTPRAHVAADGKVVLGYSVPWATNEKYRPICTSTFTVEETEHRADIGLAGLAAMKACQTIDITAADGTVFMSAYPTDFLGDQVLVDSFERRVLIEPSHRTSILELVTLTTMMRIGWPGWQHSHILREQELQAVTRQVDCIVMIESSIVPNFAAIVVQLAVYYLVTYRYALKGAPIHSATYVGLSDLISRSSINYIFFIEGAYGCVSAMGVLAWVGPAYQQLIPWGTTTAEILPLHCITLLSVLQFYVTSTCARSVIRRNIARNVVRTRSCALVQEAAGCLVAIVAVTIEFVLAFRGKYIALRQDRDQMSTYRINSAMVVGVNVIPHLLSLKPRPGPPPALSPPSKIIALAHGSRKSSQ